MYFMNVGILGSGAVGQSLARGFVLKGYDVKIGSRTPDKAEINKLINELNGKLSAGTFADTAKHGELLILCCKGQAVEEVIGLSEEKNFVNKILIDATNPLDFSKGPQPALLFGVEDSLGERIQRRLPNAKVVKCFNTVPNSQMFNPKFKDVEMLICGNDEIAKKQTTKILEEFGWKGSIDIGNIENSRWLEALVPLWVRVGAPLNTWNHVFKVLR
jgi:predicted dinucleotide-binding enzyme